MKNYITLFFVVLFCGIIDAQIINIPDANFKAKLISLGVDTNADGNIQEAEAAVVTLLNLSFSNISNLSGIEYFNNLLNLQANNNSLSSINLVGLNLLQVLNCGGNSLSSLNLSLVSNLIVLSCSGNQISNLNFNGLNNLEQLNCSTNQLTNLDVSMLTNLQIFSCSYNQLTEIDISNNINLYSFGCRNNNLINVNIKNGVEQIFSTGTILTSDDWANNPNLSYVCVDDINLSGLQFILNYSYGSTNNINLNSYCSFTPGGVFYTIQGTTKYDDGNNGCDSSDGFIPNIKFSLSNGAITGTVIANASGNYTLPVQAGTHTITPILENPSYFIVSPSSSSITFPTATSPFTQNFCISPNGVHNDLAVELIPVSVARPGFDAVYKIKYKNKGTQTQSGSVSLTFQDAVLDLVSSSPATTTAVLNTLTWSFVNLQPFETREINLVLNVNSTAETPPVNQGDVLHFSSAIVGLTDETPTDNNVEVNQIVVNAFDPNDKTCLEGSTISPSKIGDYVHYKIRFENSGTANAENVVVKDIIDTSKFDVSTLQFVASSHSCIIRISNGNKVEFIFEGINLPFDDATNDGYVVFKIKSKPTLVVGDQISNNANIYFDYNAPIVTNTAISTFQILANNSFVFGNYFTLSPVPVSNVLTINAKQDLQIKSVSIYNTLGQLVFVTISPSYVVDVAALKTGTYFIKIESDKGTANSKFIKE